jgi:serine protease DegQ
VGGDIIIALEDQPVADTEELQGLPGESEPRDVVELTLLRDGRETTVDVTLGKKS